MIFKPELIRKIQRGSKTMTRRPILPGERCRYEKGKLVAIQPGRGKRGLFYVTILEVRPEPLSAISHADARREGFRTRDEFFDYWHRLYGPPDSAGVRDMVRRLALHDPESETARALIVSIDESRRRRAERLPLPAVPVAVWVISFAKGDRRIDVPRLLRSGPPQPAICRAMIDTPKGRRPCLTGIPAPEKEGTSRHCPRCGAPAPLDMEDDHGYVRPSLRVPGRPVERPYGSLANEPEAVSEADQKKITKDARTSERQLSLAPVRERRERLEAAAKEMRGALLDSGVSHREINKKLARIDREIDSIGELLDHAA